MPMKSPRPAKGAYGGTMSLGQAAKMLHLPRREVRRLVQRGNLPFAEIQGRIRIPATALERFRGSLGRPGC